MAKAGDVIENPMTGERITFLKTTQETNGQLLRFEYVLPPGFTIPEHVHPHQEERHEVLSGMLRGRVGGQERDYTDGERVVGPAGVEIRLPGLSHTVLGSLIAARRPSVTTAIGGLVDRGLLQRGAGGAFVLCGEPSPEAVRTSASQRPALVVAR